MAMRRICSWKIGTPRVRSSTGSRLWMWVGDFLTAESPLEEGMGHIAGDRPGSDDRYLDDQVVELLRAVARQRGHLGAALDLEDTDGVGASASCGRSPDRREADVRQIELQFFRGWRISGTASSRALSMPSPSRSTLMMPRSAQSSLSH